MNPADPEQVIDWDSISDTDKEKAEAILKELNAIMDKYVKVEDVVCDDSTYCD